MIRLEYERRKRRLSQQQLGRLSGIQPHDISGFERGRVVPTDEELERLSIALGLTPGAVLLKPVAVMPEPDEEQTQALVSNVG